MNEKKIPYEELLRLLEIFAKDDEPNGVRLLAEGALDLIHRLQAENEQLKDEKEEIRLFNLSIQNGEVDMRIESEMAKSFYNSIIQIFEQNGAKNFFTTTVDIEGKKGRYAFTIEKVGGQTVAEKLADQKAEIERLTEENEHLDMVAKQALTDYQNTQVQVDELTDKLGKVLSGIKADELLLAKGVEQSIKDTAKEIYEMIDAVKEVFPNDHRGYDMAHGWSMCIDKLKEICKELTGGEKEISNETV